MGLAIPKGQVANFVEDVQRLKLFERQALGIPQYGAKLTLVTGFHVGENLALPRCVQMLVQEKANEVEV
jgi:hypothetical protein